MNFFQNEKEAQRQGYVKNNFNNNNHNNKFSYHWLKIMRGKSRFYITKNNSMNFNNTN